MKYYYLSTDEGKRKKFAYGIGDFPSEKISCDVCGRNYSRSLVTKRNLPYEMYLSNGYYPDFLWEYYRFISERAKQILFEEKVTGYILEGVTMRSFSDLSVEEIKELKRDRFKVDRIPLNPPQYYRLFIKYIAKMHKESNYILLESCDACGYTHYGTKVREDERIIIDESTLNGDDFFLLEGRGSVIYCTERFVDIYNKHNLTGLDFDEVEAY